MKRAQFFVLLNYFIPFVLGTVNNMSNKISDSQDKVLQRAKRQQLNIEDSLDTDSDQSSMLTFFPARSCHVEFKDDFGVFTPPVYYGNVDVNLWCNWTIWAGPGKHIVVYITGFQVNVDCDENQDEIIFEGVSSTVENTVVYACWNKYTHVFATQAIAVHVVFLWRTFSGVSSRKYFEGKYYVFEDYTPELSTAPCNCLLKKSEEEKMSIQLSPPTNTITYLSTEDLKAPMFNKQADVSLPSISREDISNVDVLIDFPPPTSSHKMVEMPIQVSLSNDLLRDNVASLLSLFSEGYTTSEFQWLVPEESIQVKEMGTKIVTPSERISSSKCQGEYVSRTIQIWQKESAYWLPKTSSLDSGHTLGSTLYDDLTKSAVVIHTSRVFQEQDRFAKLESSLVTFTENLYVPSDKSALGLHNQAHKTDHTHVFSKVSTSNYLELSVDEQEEKSWANFNHPWLYYTPPLDTSYAEKPEVDQLSKKDALRISDQPITLKDDTTKNISPLFVTLTLMLEFISSTEELFPSQQSHNSPPTTNTLYKTKYISDIIETSNTESTTISEQPKSLETVDMNLDFSAFPNIPSKAQTTYIASPQIHSFESDTNKDMIKKHFINQSLPSMYGLISDESMYKTHHVLAGDSHLGRLFPNLTELLEPWMITPSDVKPEQTSDHTTLLNTQLFALLESSIFFIKQLEDEQLSGVSVKPSQSILSLPTTELHVLATDFSRDRIPTALIDGNEEQRSTFSYQSASEINHILLDIGQPRSGFFDDVSTLSFFGNETYLDILHGPGDFLYAINAEIEFHEIILQELETEFTESVGEKIIETLSNLPDQFPFIILKEVKWTKENCVMLTIWLQVQGFGKGISNFIRTQLMTLTNSRVGKWNATVVLLDVDDLDECQLGIQKCHNQAYCSNELGTYSCICARGYDDHSPGAPGTVCVASESTGINFFYDHQEIMIASIACSSAILLILMLTFCVVIHKRHGKANFTLEESTPPEANVGPSLSPQRDQKQVKGCQHTASAASSTLELTKITIEQSAC